VSAKSTFKTLFYLMFAPRTPVAASPSSSRSLGAIWGGSFLMLLPGGLIVTYIGEIITGTTRHRVPSQVGLIAFLAGLVFLGFKLVTRQPNLQQQVQILAFDINVGQGSTQRRPSGVCHRSLC